ncbi:MAG: phosphopantothenate/pantothenate synthetase [Candidatus Bathyarchaeia archaeon]
MKIPDSHPRAESLRIREKLIKAHMEGLVATAGLIAHGRGEAFDYLLGEQTLPFAKRAERVAVALLLKAEKKVISVNGNSAALCAGDLVELSRLTGAQLEVNLFYRSEERELAIANELKRWGASEVLGVEAAASTSIPGLMGGRGKVDARGIAEAEVVLVPLEDGDRTAFLRKAGKVVIAIDLNPFSRTSQTASVTIIDNIVRALPNMLNEAQLLKQSPEKLDSIVLEYDNSETLSEAINFINSRLQHIANITRRNHARGA